MCVWHKRRNRRKGWFQLAFEYRMVSNDPIRFKRLWQRINREVEISSDNSIVKTTDVLNDNHVDLSGQVVWCWNGRML